MLISTKENKAIIRRWIDAWHRRNVAAGDDFVASDYVRHDPNLPEVRGPDAEKQVMTMFLNALPDLHFTIADLVAEGEKVVARYTLRGTHQGELFGIPPTHRHVAISVLEIYRLVNGKIAEQWLAGDVLGRLQQLGVVPASGQAGGKAFAEALAWPPVAASVNPYLHKEVYDVHPRKRSARASVPYGPLSTGQLGGRRRDYRPGLCAP